MNQFLKRSITFFAVSFFTLIMLGACDKDMSVMLDNSATSNVGVTIADTFTVNTSTVQLWEMPSVGIERILVGQAEAPQVGSVKSTAFFRIGFSTMANDIPEAARFDSLNLILRPTHDNYSFGDTTNVQTIRAHRLTEAMSTRSPAARFPNEELPWYLTHYNITASIFTGQTFDYNPTPIGTLAFRPHLRSLDSLNMRLDDQIGQDFFEGIKNSDGRLTSYENFREYFRGLTLVPDDNNTAIVSFSDTVRVRINYSYPGADGHRQAGFKTMNIVERGFQYNNIEYDRTGSDFAELSVTKELPTSATSGLTYVQAGTGVVAKLTFPSLKEFIHTEDMAINKAELIIETTSSRTNTMYPAPENLVLFTQDPNGVPRSPLMTPYNTQAGPQQAVFVPGAEMGQNGTYTFDLMAYLLQLKSAEAPTTPSFYLSANPLDRQIQTGQGQIIIPPNLFRGVNTAMIALEDAKPKIKLRILYTKFR